MKLIRIALETVACFLIVFAPYLIYSLAAILPH